MKTMPYHRHFQSKFILPSILYRTIVKNWSIINGVKKISFLWRMHLINDITTVNGYLRGTLTLSPIAERLELELSPPYLRFTCSSVATADRILNSRMWDKRSTTELLLKSFYYEDMFILRDDKYRYWLKWRELLIHDTF